jgi:hypothetical protein
MALLTIITFQRQYSYAKGDLVRVLKHGGALWYIAIMGTSYPAESQTLLPSYAYCIFAS